MKVGVGVVVVVVVVVMMPFNTVYKDRMITKSEGKVGHVCSYRPFIHSFIFIHSSIHSLSHSFIHSFIHSGCTSARVRWRRSARQRPPLPPLG